MAQISRSACLVMESGMYRVLAFTALGALLGACGESGRTADHGNSPAELAGLPPQNEQVEVMAEDEAKPDDRAAKPEKPAIAQSKSAKKPVIPPGQVIKPSPIVAPAEIDPVPPPVEGSEPRKED